MYVCTLINGKNVKVCLSFPEVYRIENRLAEAHMVFEDVGMSLG